MSRLRGARFAKARSPLGAPPAAILGLGTVLPGADGKLFAFLIRAAFAALRPHRVQPLKGSPP